MEERWDNRSHNRIRVILQSPSKYRPDPFGDARKPFVSHWLVILIVIVVCCESCIAVFGGR